MTDREGALKKSKDTKTAADKTLGDAKKKEQTAKANSDKAKAELAKKPEDAGLKKN